MNLDRLKQSPLFCVSLSSKELFHSNFLEFLFTKYPELIPKICKIKYDYSQVEVNREFRNTDITIKNSKNEIIVIENKIKDIAKVEQLNNIATKFDRSSIYILFSLLGDNLSFLPELQNWTEISYKHIIKVLNKFNFDDFYISSMVKDYCFFVDSIIKNIRESCSSEIYNFYHTENNLFKEWENVRLHDLFMKVGMSRFINYFNTNYNKKSIIITEYSVNHAKPTMTFSKYLDEIRYSIQIEDLQFRIGAVRKESDVKKIRNKGWYIPNYKSAHGHEYLKYKHDVEKGFYYQIEESIKLKDMEFKILAEIIIDKLGKFCT